MSRGSNQNEHLLGGDTKTLGWIRGRTWAASASGGHSDQPRPAVPPSAELSQVTVP